ncbi:Stress response protein SCP2 [Actinacidiphila yanglinensis]|uniref:Stress response protein SCP2 n=1 Tax=Actinacidiphila yanglinensis TaxID=310779 RepID=A0A1H5VBN5_9ACTN|nr:TerD family protein [Actinacidiphila yanglinensis]SEF84640.1 Stress response protein SCP2 [Actinacidiphila yanglinensis]
MAREFQRGHKAKISDLTAGTDLYVGVQISAPGLTFDISCFGLDAQEQLSDDRYFVFFNQPKSPEESIQLLGAQAGDTESFRVTLDRIPAAVHRLSFTATIDGNGQMSQVSPGYIRLVAGGEEVARYAFTGAEFSTERAVMLADIYLKDVWRFAAVGQGFDGGLDALLRNFGGEVAEEEPAAQAPQAAPGFAPPAGPAAAAPGFAPPPGPAAGTPPPLPAPTPAPAPAPVPPPAPAPAFGAPPSAPTPPPLPGAADDSIHQAPTIVGPLATPPAQAPPFGQVPPPGPPPPFPGQATPPPFPQQPGQPGQFGQPGPPGPPMGQGGYAVPQTPTLAAGISVSMQKYREQPTGQRWTQQNAKMMRADLGQGGGQPVLARQGAMVLYQGKVEFAYKGAGFRGRVVGNMTGQEMQLMRCTGGGQVFFAENASYLHPVELQGDAICVSAENVLAFDEGLQHEVRRIEGHGIPGGALFTMQFQGTGTVIVKTHGTPVVLPVTPTTYADSNAIVAWSASSQVIVSSQVRLRRSAYPGHSGETVNLQFRGAPGNFIVVQPYEV